MNIFLVIQDVESSSLLLSADVDKDTAYKDLEYYKSISKGNVRVAEIELTNKRISI